ncbi:hypothetical protein B0J11DRAFT_552225 [Dendryphion nanum]|uniref:tyrosinase n=1 Tax=Dendryphion nanum TaxID=256645 RepID=A0A9P9DH90_9PLEO|nr:hypothetical protein B0J11DRAFT_552225 [Dendryphion nanum]
MNKIYPRLEIRELEKNEDQWHLFLLGLRKFQDMDQNDKLSYYQIAGIHGRPHLTWDSVGRGPGNSGGGYCSHGINIFPTWHRPYLVLFEEVLYLKARQVVAELQDGEVKDRYRKALPSLRLPYWDSAAVPPSGQGSLPMCLQSPKIDVKLPNGTNTIDNPLYSYRFHPLNQNDLPDYPLANWTTTLRDPSSRDSNAASRNDLIAREADQTRPNLQSRVYDLLALQKEYMPISNDREAGDSFESIHNTPHNTIGSGGHMSYVGYAAFDPIFWFHHCNLDRMFAIWQALNPNSYVQPKESPYSTYTSPSGVVIDTNSALKPFHRNHDGTFWTSETVRYPSAFGYTYPELVGMKNGNTAPLVRKVNELYGPNARAQKRSIIGTYQALGAPTFSGRRQYTTNIKANKFGLGGSFNCYVFLGDQEITSDATQWTEQDSFVGFTGIFSQSNQKADIEAYGAVPLTAALEDRVRAGKLASMEEQDVGGYLKSNLKWRIARPTGEQVNVEHTPGFKVSVLWTEVEPAQSLEQFPKKMGGYRVLVNATAGRPGGFGIEDIVREIGMEDFYF